MMFLAAAIGFWVAGITFIYALKWFTNFLWLLPPFCSRLGFFVCPSNELQAMLAVMLAKRRVDKSCAIWLCAAKKPTRTQDSNANDCYAADWSSCRHHARSEVEWIKNTHCTHSSQLFFQLLLTSRNVRRFMSTRRARIFIGRWACCIMKSRRRCTGREKLGHSQA